MDKDRTTTCGRHGEIIDGCCPPSHYEKPSKKKLTKFQKEFLKTINRALTRT